MNNNYRICCSCVMDTTDPEIVFNQEGVCDHCLDFREKILPKWDTGPASQKLLYKKVSEIQKAGRGRDFDCILGLSGGLDSSFMLHRMVKDFGLRPLVFHVDGGWNSELAVHNIQVLVEKLGLDLFTHVVEWSEMRDLQLAFFKAGVPHLDIPQDHAFVATLYRFAEKYKIRYIFNGGNYSTEVVRRPLKYFYWGTDMLHIRDVISKFGSVPMKTYPFSSIFRHKIYLKYIKQIEVVKPLNLVPYNQADAIRELENEYGWKSYTQKHFESRFTKFLEGYWLPSRFGFDVRREQLSSLVITGQMSRESALDRLKFPPYSEHDVAHDCEFIAAKLGIAISDLNEFHTMERKYYYDYRNQRSIINFGRSILSSLGLDRGGVR